MNTEADEALLSALIAATQPGELIGVDLIKSAHDRLNELLKQKHDLFLQLIEQLDHIDDLEEHIRNNS